MIRRSCLLYLDDLKVNVDISEIGQNLWRPRKTSISFFKWGSSSSGLKLSIAPICEKKVLGMIRRSCLLYLDDLKVRQNWSKSWKSDPAILAILIIWVLKLGLKTLYTSMTNAFSPIRPKLKFTLTSDAVKFFPISTVYFGRPLARLLGLRWRPCN